MRSSKCLFNDIGVARQVATLVHRQSAELNTSLAEVERECSADEFSRYRTAVGKIMGAMFTEVLEPTWEAFPELAPDALRDQYVSEPEK